MPRTYCDKCCRPPPTCYCAWITPVATKTRFVILMHPDERRRRIATGRMSHLSLPNSEILIGDTFRDHPRLAELIAQPHTYLLYPDAHATACQNVPVSRQRTVIVLDGKWTQSQQMLRHSPQLARLPRLSFGRNYRSLFTIKRQPEEHCLSTLEAITYTISELPDEKTGAALPLLPPYFFVINQQMQFERGPSLTP